MAQFPEFAKLSNLAIIEELYGKYLADPAEVDPSWRHFFEGIEFAKFLESRGGRNECGADPLIHAYRKYGHLLAPINPLKAPSETLPNELDPAKLGYPDLKALVSSKGFSLEPEVSVESLVGALKQVYCSRIGFEYMGLDNPEMQQWIQKRIEPKLDLAISEEERRFLLEYLHKSEAFETFLHTKYVGQKRFSIEGGETLIPLLAEVIERGSELGMEQFVIGMAHRGRLNVLANILGKSYSVIFKEFEDTFLPFTFEGSGDVKYHKGFSSDIETKKGKKVHLHLAANSSCLESVDPVALGLARAKQVVANDAERKRIGAVLIHGDASISGQGVVYESMELMRLDGYATGGTIHIVVNNQIGFTTLPEEGRSTRYCTDIAKTFGCPVFHVNAEDPESCLFVAKLAVELRLHFQCDVFIDLVCYRKYGHNEGDEPSFTQPSQYQAIRSKKSIRTLYLESLSGQEQLIREVEARFHALLDQSLQKAKAESAMEPHERFGVSWADFKQPPVDMLFESFSSAAPQELIVRAADGFCKVPEGFHFHQKLQKWLQDRRAMIEPTGKVDWGMAECLAFGTLLLQQVPIRLAGQDSRRGTFSQRHAVWVDQDTSELYFPYSHLDAKQSRFDVYNSPLSEFACLAFEYGYSWGDLKGLVVWEAQYGDFTIGAQTVVDHYITTAEQKWARYSSLVLLLPHGYEGQGPEHSSGRIERFLQLAAQNNTQIANPTTPAQYFHLLRRQALRPIKKPLIVFTPKSLLRLPACSSKLEDLTQGEFREVLDDPISIANPRRVLLCSGRIFYDLMAEREKRKQSDIAILRIEQLYPIHQKKLEALLERYISCKDLCWVQDEPENMGAWEFVRAYLPGARYLGRVSNAVTATGSHKQHKQEQDKFMNEAFQ